MIPVGDAPKPIERSKVADEWLAKNQQNFASHATKHHNVILTSKVLNCAEEVLRTKGKVENEAHGFGLRDETGIEKFTETNEVPWFTLQKVSSKTNNYVETWIFPKFSESATNIEDLKAEFKVKDRGAFWTAKEKNVNQENETDPSTGPRKTHFRDVASYKDHPLPGTSMAADEKNGRAIDHQLREVYKYAMKKNVKPSQAQEGISNARIRVLGTAKARLAHDIAVEKNGVRWAYGPIAILIGNPKDKLASPNKWEKGLRHEEFRLKKPFQTEEGFYQVNMTDQDSLILGPKSLLDKYRERKDIEDSVKARFLDIESLTPEQLQIFNIDAKTYDLIMNMAKKALLANNPEIK